MKKIISLALALMLAFATLTACDDSSNAPSGANNGSSLQNQNHVAPSADDIDFTELAAIDGITESEAPTDYVMIDVKNYGKIVVRLYPDVAPQSVANFKSLVSQKFYDGLIFHRVIKGFMIQGGDPEGTGMGGSDTEIYGEFASNGFKNNLAHKRGVVAMARSNDPNSASSQFYICHKTSRVESLDGNYATFGYVIYGMDVVDAIAKTSTNGNDKPLKDIVMNSIRFVNIPKEAFEQPEETRDAPTSDEIDTSDIESLDSVEVVEEQTDYVLLDIKNYGKVLIRLYPDVAPATVENFKNLVSKKFYDGLIFHRVIKDFMIQGGASLDDSAQTIPGEFSSNGFENNLTIKRGVVAMARTNDPNSASSQFFICQDDAGVAHLNGEYAAFGYVVYGMDAVDAIAKVSVNSNDKPLENVVITSASFAKINTAE